MRVTLKDLAADLGVSIGTINRALNNKSDINPETKQRVLSRASELSYRTNASAKSLGLKKKFNIIFAPLLSYGDFYRDVEIGILQALSEYMDFNMHVTNVYLDGIEDESAYDKLEAATRRNTDAVIMFPINDVLLRRSEEMLLSRDIPLVIVDGGCHKGKNLCNICLDTYKNGQIAGTLMKKFLRQGEEVVLILENQGYGGHKEKKQGFLNSFGNDVKYYQISSSNDDVAYLQMKELLARYPKIRGAYSTTSAFQGALEAIKKCRPLEHVFFIGTDVTRNNLKSIQNGDVDILLYQAPFEQGKIAINVLYEYFLLNQRPDKTVYVRSEIVTLHNAESYFTGD